MEPSPHILLVNDDREARVPLRSYLEKLGYRTTEVSSVQGMRRALEQSQIDFVVLDSTLPEQDKLTTLCRDLRTVSRVPVLMLTELQDDGEPLPGSEAGADDYLVKPINPRELVFRIKAVLRRVTEARQNTETRFYRFGDWQLDTVSRSLLRADETRIVLSGAEYRLLSLLLAHPGRVLKRVQLMELLRGRELDPLDRSIDVRIHRLRQLLGDDARSPQIIKTVYGQGYVMGVPVEAVENLEILK